VKRNRITLTSKQRLQLRNLAESEGLSKRLGFRARIILELADGASFRDVKQHLRTSAPTICHWQRQFNTSGVSGLVSRHPGQRPSVLTAELRARIIQAATNDSKDGSKRGSLRMLAAAIGVSKDTVCRALKRAALEALPSASPSSPAPQTVDPEIKTNQGDQTKVCSP